MSLFRDKNVRLAGGLTLAGASLLTAVALTRELAPDAAPDDSKGSYPTSAAPATEQALEDLSHQFRAIARRVEPSVVHIEVLGARRASGPGTHAQDAGPRRKIVPSGHLPTACDSRIRRARAFGSGASAIPDRG